MHSPIAQQCSATAHNVYKSKNKNSLLSKTVNFPQPKLLLYVGTIKFAVGISKGVLFFWFGSESFEKKKHA